MHQRRIFKKLCFDGLRVGRVALVAVFRVGGIGNCHVFIVVQVHGVVLKIGLVANRKNFRTRSHTAHIRVEVAGSGKNSRHTVAVVAVEHVVGAENVGIPALKVNVRAKRAVVAHEHGYAGAVVFVARRMIHVEQVGSVQGAAAGIVGFWRRRQQLEGTHEGQSRRSRKGVFAQPHMQHTVLVAFFHHRDAAASAHFRSVGDADLRVKLQVYFDHVALHGPFAPGLLAQASGQFPLGSHRHYAAYAERRQTIQVEIFRNGNQICAKRHITNEPESGAFGFGTQACRRDFGALDVPEVVAQDKFVRRYGGILPDRLKIFGEKLRSPIETDGLVILGKGRRKGKTAKPAGNNK
jgi:hypothetical protein